MNLRKQHLITCPGRTARYPPSECIPFACFKELNYESHEFFDLDGYTINFGRQKATALFLKREFSIDANSDINEDKLKAHFLLHEDSREIENQVRLSEMLSIPLILVMWPFDYPNKTYTNLGETVFIFKISKLNDHLNIELLEKGDKDTLQMFIRKHRGRSFSYVKPLTISKSYMECYLSGTANPWPGDLDGIIKFKGDSEIKGLFEFKTHNLDTPIEQEHMDKYASQDLRRFNVLFFLQKQIGAFQNKEPPIFFIVWGTRSHHKKVKLQILSEHKVRKEILLETSNDDNYRRLLDEIIKYIA